MEPLYRPKLEIVATKRVFGTCFIGLWVSEALGAADPVSYLV